MIGEVANLLVSAKFDDDGERSLLRRRCAGSAGIMRGDSAANETGANQRTAKNEEGDAPFAARVGTPGRDLVVNPNFAPLPVAANRA